MSARGLVSRALKGVKLVPVIAVCSLLAACDDGPTAPSIRLVPTSVPARATPTPVPVPNVAGMWGGTFNPGQYCGGVASASATFSLDGSRVTGSVTTTSSQLPSGRFEGEFQGFHLSGTLKIGSTTKTVTGSASATVMTMRFPGSGFLCPTSSIMLAR